MNIQSSGACLETVGCLGLSSYIIYVWICHLVMYVCTLHTDRGTLSNITYIIMLNAKCVNPKHNTLSVAIMICVSLFVKICSSCIVIIKKVFDPQKFIASKFYYSSISQCLIYNV